MLFFDGQIVKQGRFVGHEREPRFGFDRAGSDVIAGDRQPPAAGGNDSRDRPHGGRFSGAVGANDPQDLARFDPKADAPHGDMVGKRLMETLDLNHAEVPRCESWPEGIAARQETTELAAL